MTPLEFLRLYRIYRAYKTDEREHTTMTIKIPQFVILFTSLLGTIGVPTLAMNWLHSHLIAYTVFVSIAIVLHAFFPSIFQSTPSVADQEATGFMTKTVETTKTIPAIVLCLLAFALMSQSINAQDSRVYVPQEVSNLYMGGASYSPAGTPSTAGSAMYAHAVNNSGTYAFTMIDALPASYKPFTVTTDVGVGIAQNIFTVGRVPVFVPTAAGISYTGSNVGWTWSSGVGFPLQYRKSNWYIMPTIRILKSSVTGSTGYQPIIGILFGWGQ
jgi:hypothetical protein